MAAWLLRTQRLSSALHFSGRRGSSKRGYGGSGKTKGKRRRRRRRRKRKRRRRKRRRRRGEGKDEKEEEEKEEQEGKEEGEGEREEMRRQEKDQPCLFFRRKQERAIIRCAAGTVAPKGLAGGLAGSVAPHAGMPGRF